MSTVDDFRRRVQACLDTLTDYSNSTIGRQDTLQDLAVGIHIELGVEALLSKTPIRPVQLREITKQIEELPLVREIVGDWPNVGVPDSTVWDRDLPVLEVKLKEMLEYLPPSGTESAKEPPGPDDPARQQVASKRRRGPPAKMERHDKIAEIVRKHGSNWRNDEILATIADELERHKVPISPDWREWDSPARSWGRAVANYADRVRKTIAYSLKMAKKGNSGYSG